MSVFILGIATTTQSLIIRWYCLLLFSITCIQTRWCSKL